MYKNQEEKTEIFNYEGHEQKGEITMKEKLRKKGISLLDGTDSYYDGKPVKNDISIIEE